MLTIEGLSRSFESKGEPPIPALAEISLHVEQGEFFSIVGPSGCGKTTLLRCIAGLEEPDSGKITIGGTVAYSSDRRINLPPQRRGISLMFQSRSVWPHLSVFENVAFPLRARGQKKVDREVMDMLETVSLRDAAQRPASNLSGGQQQRLALARAMISRPQVLLLDEPLSSLDAGLRRQMRLELKHIQQHHNVTTIYVTHDQEEALSLSDRVAVMNAGRCLQVAPARLVYEAPASQTVAELVGKANFIAATVISNEPDGSTRFSTGIGVLTANAASVLAPGASVILSFRPENLHVAAAGRQGPNVLSAVISAAMYCGDHEDLEIDCAGTMLVGRVASDQMFERGQSVDIEIAPRDLRVHALP